MLMGMASPEGAAGDHGRQNLTLGWKNLDELTMKHFSELFTFTACRDCWWGICSDAPKGMDQTVLKSKAKTNKSPS